MRRYDRLDHLTAAFPAVLREVAVLVHRDLDRAMPEPARHFVDGYAARQGHGGPFVSQVVWIVFGQPEPPDGPIPRLTQEIGVWQAAICVMDRKSTDERLKGSGYGYIAPLTFFSVLQRGIAGCVPSVGSLIASHLPPCSQGAAVNVFREYSQRFPYAKPATGHEPYSWRQARTDFLSQGGYLVEAGKAPIVDRDDRVVQLLGLCHWAAGYLPVTCSVGEDGREDYVAGLDGIEGRPLPVPTGVQALDVSRSDLGDRLAPQVGAMWRRMMRS